MENWVIKNKKADFQAMMHKHGISEVIARCLVNKGFEQEVDIERYLNPKLEYLHNPFLMRDMNKACDILMKKIKDKSKIRIIGDYDVDGVVSTYVLLQALTFMGANVDYEIPDRIKDGYGINSNMVKAAFEDQVDTLLTCDNGIVAIDQVALAKEYGMTVIITDHHSILKSEEGESILPPADAIVNPKQEDCSYPFSGLCGAAIAYKLSIALMKLCSLPERTSLTEELLSYVAIATVCDVMDLIDENRTIVKYGLQLLKTTSNLGLTALMEVSGVDKLQLSAFHLGFVIGPCLNASGRLDTAKKGLELLLTKNEADAVRLAGEVKSLNDIRKDMTAKSVEKAIQMIEESSIKNDKVLVVYLPDCHESLAGIIAGRLRERYHKPAIVLTEAEECVKGSARSIEQYNIIEELVKYKELLLKVGGHPMAAGLSLKQENVEELRGSLNRNTTLTEEMLIPKITIDILLPFGYLSENLIEELKLLEPYGKANEKPLFAEKDLTIKAAYIIGKNKSGIRFRLENSYHKEMEALYFGDVESFFSYIEKNYGSEEAQKLRTGRSTKAKLTVTYYPKVNEYNGSKNIQLMIQNYR